jgi:transcriptional regulator with XRE-family HTH domain
MDLRASRESCGRTETDVARVLGVTEATVKRWEKSNDPKIPLSQFPLFLALYGLEVDSEAAKETLRDKAPTVDSLVVEAANKEAWSPLWIRESVVYPAAAKELVQMAIAVMDKLAVHIDNRRPVLLGQLLINTSADFIATHGMNDINDEAC